MSGVNILICDAFLFIIMFKVKKDSSAVSHNYK